MAESGPPHTLLRRPASNQSDPNPTFRIHSTMVRGFFKPSFLLQDKSRPYPSHKTIKIARLFLFTLFLWRKAGGALGVVGVGRSTPWDKRHCSGEGLQEAHTKERCLLATVQAERSVRVCVCVCVEGWWWCGGDGVQTPQRNDSVDPNQINSLPPFSDLLRRVWLLDATKWHIHATKMCSCYVYRRCCCRLLSGVQDLSRIKDPNFQTRRNRKPCSAP